MTLTDEEKELLQFHLEHLSLFLKEFFHDGNWDFKLEIYPRDVQSGLWYSAEWKDKDNYLRRAEAQRSGLFWERVITKHLIAQRKEQT